MMRFSAVALGLALVVGTNGPACAAGPAPGTEADSGPIELLARMRKASDHQTYAGTFVYQQGAEVRSSRIVHAQVGAHAFEKLQALDGVAREVLRHDDEVRALVPETRTIIVERGTPRGASFPARLRVEPGPLAALYRVRRIAAERVAAHQTEAIALEPVDGLRYGYRLYADRASGLLLKEQTLDERGAVIEQMAFTELRIGGPLAHGALEPSWNTANWTVERADAISTASAGWVVNAPVPGFDRVTEVRRTLAGHGEVGQIVYSDGVAAVSIFIEPLAGAPAGHADGHRDAVSSEGAVNGLGRRLGAYWITVLGDVPRATIRRFADGLQLKSSSRP